MQNFDRPFFKRLSHNDTGGAAGHQAGIVVPKSLDAFFPRLTGVASASNPTISAWIRAFLFVGTEQVGLVNTRYQYQTWGGTRPPERRITDNLSALRNAAYKDDFLIIERSLYDTNYFRLTLHKSGTSTFTSLAAKVGSRRWGPVELSDPPLTELEVAQRLAEQQKREQQPFTLFDNIAALTESRVTRIARSRAFSQRVLALYNSACAICGNSYVSLAGVSEAEAAHIVPRSLKGTDDARNGLALCRSHHWAFDHGLLGIRDDRTIAVPSPVAAIPQNAHLASLDGQPVTQPSALNLQPDPSALAWHLTNIVGYYV